MLFLAAPVFGQTGSKAVQIKVGKEAVEFLVGDELVTRYHTAGYAKPIFWPVNAPGKLPLTRAWPMEKGAKGESTDHLHQKSAWFCHGDVIPEGVDLKQKIKGVDGVDFWSEAKGHGQMVCTKVGAPKLAGDRGVLKTHNEWRTADDEKIMDEERTITFLDLGKTRLFIFDIDLHASVCPITFADTKEGALGIRINDEIRADKTGKGKIQNAEGKLGEKECWGQNSLWCDYSGPIEGKVVGLTLLADPKNAHPTAWHVRGYGLMAANPFGRTKAAFPATKGRTDLVRLDKGQHLVVRYGMLLHEGDAETGRVAEGFERFVGLRGKE
jgi:hypothetical protein